MQRAYKEMEEAGLIFTEGNMPSRVTKDDEVVKSIRNSLLQDSITDFITSVQSLNVPLEEIIPLIEEKYKNENVQSEEDDND